MIAREDVVDEVFDNIKDHLEGRQFPSLEGADPLYHDTVSMAVRYFENVDETDRSLYLQLININVTKRVCQFMIDNSRPTSSIMINVMRIVETSIRQIEAAVKRSIKA